MNELSSDAKKLFRVARESFSPDSDRVAAVRAALEARASAAAGQSSAPMKSAALDGAGWSIQRLVGIGALVVAGTGALVIGYRSIPAAPNRPLARPEARIAAPSLIPKSDARPESVLPAAAQPGISLGFESPDVGASAALAPVNAAAAASKRPAARREAHLREKPGEQTARSLVGEETSDSLAQEIALVLKARAALERNDAVEALALLEQHQALYPLGTLQQERLATRVLALCALGRVPEARTAARELERAAPRSPYLARIRVSCAGEQSVKITK